MAKEKFDFIQPLKDIPSAFKGFPKNLVRLWKEPVNSSDEVKTRKKELFPLLYAFAILTIVIVLLSIIPFLSFLSAVACIPALGVAYCIFLLVVCNAAAKKFADIECDNCKHRIAFDENVTIKVIDKNFTVKKESKTIEKDGIPVQATISAKGEETITVEVGCKCQECGTEKTFTHKFVSMRCNKTAVKIPYTQSGAMLVMFESDLNNAYNSGAMETLGHIRPQSGEVIVGGKSASSKEVGNGVNVTLNRSPEALVEGYFGNDLSL